jgi:hypothetical protein
MKSFLVRSGFRFQRKKVLLLTKSGTLKTLVEASSSLCWNVLALID